MSHQLPGAAGCLSDGQFHDSNRVKVRVWVTVRANLVVVTYMNQSGGTCSRSLIDNLLYSSGIFPTELGA